MATGYLKAARENIPGNETNTTVLSTKIAYIPALSFNVSLGPDHLMRDDELRGLDEAVAAIPEGYAPQWSIETRAYPDVAAFLMACAFGSPTTTVGNGVITDPDTVAIPAGAYKHVWTSPFLPTGVNPQTTEFIAAFKDQSVFFRLKGCGVTQLSIDSPSRGGCRIKASGPCLYVARISDPALTPAYEALTVKPWVGGNFTIPTWLSGSANFERSGFGLQWQNDMDTYESGSIASKFPDQLEKGDAPVLLTGSAPKRLIDIDDYDALLAATGFGMKCRWISDSMATGVYPYKMFVEAANVQLLDGGPDDLANRRRIGGSFNWKATNATGTNGSQTITIVNSTASYV